MTFVVHSAAVSQRSSIFLALLFLACLLFANAAPTSSSAGNNLPPLIIVPGLTASDLAYKLDNFTSFYPWCKQYSPWALLWPQQKSTYNPPDQIYCWLQALQVFYYPDAKAFIDWPGVNVTTISFGSFIGTSFAKLAQPYISAGWKLGKNLFCAPYDWRLIGSNMKTFHAQLQGLVESTYASTGQRVNLLGISFGPQVTLSFLHTMTPEWRTKYIHWFVAESPVWSGSPAMVESFVSGFGDDNSSSYLRQISLRLASGLWLMPRAGATNTTFGSDLVIVRTPARSYTAYDIVQLFEDLGLEGLLPGLQAATEDAVLAQFDAPLVDTFVAYGYGLGTPGYYEYDAPFVANASITPPLPSVILNLTESGDELVPLRSSLRSLYAWPALQQAAGKQFLQRGYEGQPHGLCCVPEGGVCFTDVLNLLVNGTMPPMDAPHAQQQALTDDADVIQPVLEVDRMVGRGFLFPPRVRKQK